MITSWLQRERSCFPNPLFWRPLSTEVKRQLTRTKKKETVSSHYKLLLTIPIVSKELLTAQKHRPPLVSYIFETVCNHLCSKTAAFMAVQFLDRLIEKDGYYAFVLKQGSVLPAINENTCQMIALACSMIAMKIEDSNLEFELNELMWDEDECLEMFKKNLLKTECSILNCLEWKLETPNCGFWISVLKGDQSKMEGLCEMVVKEEESLQFLSSYLVASVLLFLGGKEEFGYTKSQLQKGVQLVEKVSKKMV